MPALWRGDMRPIKWTPPRPVTVHHVVSDFLTIEAECIVRSPGYYNTPEDSDGPDVDIVSCEMQFETGERDYPPDRLMDREVEAIEGLAADAAAKDARREDEGRREEAGDLGRRLGRWG